MSNCTAKTLILACITLFISGIAVDAAARTLNSQPSSLDTFSPVFPNITLINQEGDKVTLKNLLAEDRSILFAFFFTQCITICTTTTFNMKSVSKSLPGGTTLALISIDPANDTPRALKEYARQHQLDSGQWQLLTGSREDLESFQRTLDSYRGNKMNHNTSIFMKKAGSPVITEVPDNFHAIPRLIKQ